MTQLPNSWQLLTLGDVAHWTSGGTPSSKNSDYYDGDIPWVCIGDLNEGSVLETAKRITKAGLDSSSAKVMPKGTIMLAMYATSIGDTGIMETSMATNQAIACGVPNPEIIAGKYLLYYLQSQKHEFFAAGRGGAQPNINQGIVKGWPIPVPSIDEQNKIVELLEDHLSRLDAALADVNQGQKKIRQFRRSFLQDTFIEREGTRDCSLGDVVEIKTGKIDANKAVPDGKYPFFTCAREISRIDDAPFDGKVVLVAGNGDLNVKYYEGKFNAYQRTYILKSKNEEILFPKYLFWFMEHYIFELRTLAIGTTIKYIKLGNLMDAIMSLPANDIQKQMVLEIERSLSFVDNSEETFTNLIRESRSLRRAILNSAFLGELTNGVLHV